MHCLNSHCCQNIKAGKTHLLQDEFLILLVTCNSTTDQNPTHFSNSEMYTAELTYLTAI